MTTSFRLPLTFLPASLQHDLALIRAEEWVPHYNRGDYEGEWTGVALRSAGGAASNLYADPSPQAIFTGTPVLARCPYFQEVLTQFQCPLRAVRLLRLAPGALIREHRDPGLGRHDSEVRIHVPVATNPDVDFVVAGRLVVMNVGETWHIDFTQPHRVANRGATDRTHLVLDCVVNDWLRSLLPPVEPRAAAIACAAPTPNSGPANFDQFRTLVLHDLALQEELRAIADAACFIERAVQLGTERGCFFGAADVEEALRTACRAWLERWIA